MTVAVQDTVFRHVGNDVTVDFAYGCQILYASDLIVYVNDVPTTTGFTVSGLGNPTGGTVSFASTPANGASIVLERVVKLERTTDYQQSGDMFTATVNRDFDRLWMALQQFELQLGLAPGSVTRVLRLGMNDVSGSGAYRALQNRIQDLGDAVNEQDSMNLRKTRSLIETLIAGIPGGVGSFIQAGPGAVARTFQSKLRDVVNVRDFGAICDGTSRPLSGLYATLAAAQAAYPSATALTDELDSVAIQSTFDAIGDNTEIVISGVAVSNKTLYLSGKKNATIKADGAKLRVGAGAQYSLVIHGGTVDRTLTGTPWADQFLSGAYETTTPCKNVKVKGLTVESSTGGRVSTQVMFYFADDCVADITVKNSNGNGVEFRHCVRPAFHEIGVEDTTNFGLFVYQCYGLQGGLLRTSNCGRAYDLKQRHKFYNTLDFRIDRVIAADLFGVSDPAWCTGGGTYNDLVRAGYSAAIQANRNFAGHEICRNVTIGRHDLFVTTLVGVSTPSTHIGCFADNWAFNEINYYGNGIDSTTIPLIIGGRGDIAEGLAGGATFGKRHRIGNISFNGFTFTNANPLIRYAVPGIIERATYKNCTVAKILDQLTPVGSLPFGSIEEFEFRRNTGDITMLMGPLATRGVVIEADTKRFISGGNKLKVTPINFNAESMCNPWYVKSDEWLVVGEDEIEVVSGGAGASNHVSTYSMYSTAISGRIRVKATATAPTNVRGLGLASATSTKGLILEASTFVLVGVPATEKLAIVTSGEINLVGLNTYTGAWATNVSDTSGKNAGQNLRRILYGTAAPTTGAWDQGDRVINQAPAVGSPKAWTCTVSGTPGTWVSEGNL